MVEAIEELAVRSSRREISSNTQQQALMEDIIWGNGVSVDEFSVDDLLDLSNEHQFESFFKDVKEEEEEDEEEEEEEEESKDDSVSVSSQERPHKDGISNSSVATFGTLPSVPVDEWKDLEWVSQFVDDSAIEFPQIIAAAKDNFLPRLENYSYKKTIPTKPRNSRRRISTKTWFFAALPKAPSPEKKQRKKRTIFGELKEQRRCCHCHAQKTPQWRSGPLGAKTLCNACGVRFKSGRLVPEYRPACSPTFSVDVHSNSHRKVLEIRRKKESAAAAKVVVASAGL